MNTKNNFNCLHVVSAKVWGGGETYVLNLVKYAKENGDFCAVSIDKRATQITSKFSITDKILTLTFKPHLLFFNIIKLLHFIKENKITHICYHSGKVSLLCTLTAKIANIHCICFKHNIIPGKNDLYHKFILKNTSAVICVSNTVKNINIKNIDKALHSKFYTIHTGIPIPKMSNRNSNKIIRIGYAGRIVENKGIVTLLDSFTKLANPFIELVIAGDSSTNYASTLKNKYSQKNIHFIGLQSNMEDFYRSIDIFVVPSIVPEAFSLSICESMANGLPVISTRSGSQEEIIKDKVNGLLINASSVDELTFALNTLIKDPQLRQTLGQKAYLTMKENFSFSQFYKKVKHRLISIS